VKIMKEGFSIIELVIAIFLIAIVIGAVLLLMAANLNVVQKSNEIMVANALAQYSVEEMKNIEFPPVYRDRQDELGQETNSGFTVGSGEDFTPPLFADSFKVERYVIGYDAAGEIASFDAGKYDEASTLRVEIYVLRGKDDHVLSHTTAFFARNGMF